MKKPIGVWIVASAIVCQLAAMAVAQTVGEKAPSYVLETEEEDGKKGEIRKLDDLRGLVVVLYFFKANDPASTDPMEEIGRLNRMAGVEVTAFSPDKKEDVDRIMEAKGKPFAYSWENKRATTLYDVSHYPRAYIIDPSGTIAWRGHPGELSERLKAQMRMTPPIGADESSLKTKLARSESAMNSGDIATAFSLAKQVVSISSEGESLHNDAAALQTKIEEKVKTELESARQMITDKKYKEAATLLAGLKVRMEGHDLAKDIETEINRMRGARDSKEIVETEIKNARGHVALEEANELLEYKRYVDAERSFRDVRDKFEETPAAEAADAELKKIRGDAEMRKVIRAHYDEVQADNWLDIGNRFAKLELYKEAKEYFTRVTKEHPNSPAAKRAAERLKELPSS